MRPGFVLPDIPVNRPAATASGCRHTANRMLYGYFLYAILA